MIWDPLLLPPAQDSGELSREAATPLMLLPRPSWVS